MKKVILILCLFSQIIVSQDNGSGWSKIFRPGLGLKEDGSLWYWGNWASNIKIYKNQHIVTSLTPKKISNDNDKWMQIGRNGNNAFILLNDDGKIWIQLGMSTIEGGLEQLGNDNDWAFIQNTGVNDFCIYGIKKDETLWQIIASKRETKIEQIGIDKWVYVQGDECNAATLGLKTDGTLWSWGRYTPAFGLIDYQKEPRQLGADNWKMFSVSYGLSGADITTAIKMDGTLWFLGVASEKFKPTQLGIANDWFTVSVASTHVLAIKENGTLWTCCTDLGSNIHGELGNGTKIQSEKLKQIGNDSDWSKVFAFDEVSYAIKKDGSLWAWGNNFSGQLGLGNEGLHSERLVPSKVE